MKNRFPTPERGDVGPILILVEATVLMIALIMPVTPSKTGSSWNPAGLIWPDTSYAKEVVAWFIVAHILLAIVGVGIWIVTRRAVEGD